MNLFDKYDTPVPRYTSYPPVPNWKGNLSPDEWIRSLKCDMSKKDVSWSLYMHLPFCESLCTFCACNNVITRDHSREDRYISAIQKEWNYYLEKIPDFKIKKIRQIHLGGGSPTFFSARNLKLLLEPFFDNLKIDFNSFEGAIEIDPRRCTFDQLKTLRDMGFNRVSLGVQDLDLNVQINVNRIQPFELVQKCVTDARQLGYQSVNFDLIYGLPGQTEESIKKTAEKVMELRPDRIALYSLAVVPWLRPAQNRFQKMDIKVGAEKRKLFESARIVFHESGYVSLGIDHFALPTDSISKSYTDQTMHRNFMGYTEYATDVLLGLGVSSISETSDCYQQNKKELDQYYKSLEEDPVTLPLAKGHLLDDVDKEIKNYILNLMTSGSAEFKDGFLNKSEFQDMIQEGLVQFDNNRLCITERGNAFTRHICHLVDRYAFLTKGIKKFSSGI